MLWLGGYSTTVVYGSSSLGEDDITLKYQEFLREEAKEHRLFLEDSFDKLIMLFTGGVFMCVGILTWLNYKTKAEIHQTVERHFDLNISECIQKKIQTVQNEIDSKMKEIKNRSKLIEQILMELSARENAITTDKVNYDFSAKNRPNLKTHDKRVLWVDDNPENNYYIIQLLNNSGIITDTVTSTDKAITQLQKRNYDLVISDMDRNGIPDEGITLLKQINKKHLCIPVVFFTSANSMSKYSNIAYLEGAVYLTDKTSNLIGYIQRLLDNHSD